MQAKAHVHTGKVVSLIRMFRLLAIMQLSEFGEIDFVDRNIVRSPEVSQHLCHNPTKLPVLPKLVCLQII